MSWARDAARDAHRELREAREEITKLRERCAGYKGQVECGAKEIERLSAALQEIHRRTGLLMHQNTGRWSASNEADKRAMDVLAVNQRIAFEAVEVEQKLDKSEG